MRAALALLLLTASALAVALSAGFPAWASEIYRCEAKAIATAESNGSIVLSDKNPLLSTWGEFLVDTETGLVWIGRIVFHRWTILQKGSAENDFVAAQASDPGVAPLHMLRLRMWADMPVPTFIMSGLSEMTTGTCRVVR